MRSYTEIHNIVRALNGQWNILFPQYQQLKVDDKDDNLYMSPTDNKPTMHISTQVI